VLLILNNPVYDPRNSIVVEDNKHQWYEVFKYDLQEGRKKHLDFFISIKKSKDKSHGHQERQNYQQEFHGKTYLTTLIYLIPDDIIGRLCLFNFPVLDI